MPDSPRIQEFRRRIDIDPASIAFAELAGELRREGRFGEAIQTCRFGLARHPTFLSARVSLGRCLIETGELESARAELDIVSRIAPENVGALMALGDLHGRLGEPREAAEYYRRARDARGADPELEATLSDAVREMEAASVPPALPAPPVEAQPTATGHREVVYLADRAHSTPPVTSTNDTTAVVRALEEFLSAVHAARRRRRTA
jgi:tetratricopeptide (TPR) repeat protein